MAGGERGTHSPASARRAPRRAAVPGNLAGGAQVERPRESLEPPGPLALPCPEAA